MTDPSHVPGLLAHEWVEEIGGSENVVEVFARLWPHADLFALWINAPQRFASLSQFESHLARPPWRGRKALALPLMSRAWRSADLRAYDWALISSHALAHHVGAGPLQRHLRRFVYVHTPARYLWAADIDPRGHKPFVRAAAPLLRRQDRRHVRPAKFAANSAFVQARVREAWGVDCVVIHPPVAVAELRSLPDWSVRLTSEEKELLDRLPDEYLCGASRFVGYKELHRVLEVGAALGKPVVIAGRGPAERALRHRARQLGVDAHFVVAPSDELLRAVIQRAIAFVYPPVEDFGIIAAEAVALGTPTLVNEVGGAKEIVSLTEGGVTMDFSRPRSWGAALRSALELSMDSASMSSEVLSEESFESQILAWVEDAGVSST